MDKYHCLSSIDTGDVRPSDTPDASSANHHITKEQNKGNNPRRDFGTAQQPTGEEDDDSLHDDKNDDENQQDEKAAVLKLRREAERARNHRQGLELNEAHYWHLHLTHSLSLSNLDQLHSK